MFGLLAQIKNYFSYILIAVGTVAVTFTVLSVYNTLVENPKVRREMALTMVSKAEHSALQAQIALQQREKQFLDQSLERYKKLSTELIRDKEQLEKDSEKKILEDVSPDGCTVTQEDLDWLDR